MELEGEVISIIYKNDVNSYTIAEFETEDDMLTIVGYLPFISIGDSLKIIGKFVEHQEYGKQFKVDTFEKKMPQTTKALERYLANCGIKGVGPATAQNIVNMFGEDTLNVFKFEPQKLAQVKGISKDKAIEIRELAQKSIGLNSNSVSFELKQTISIIQFLQQQIDDIEKRIKEKQERKIDKVKKQEIPYKILEKTGTTYKLSKGDDEHRR